MASKPTPSELFEAHYGGDKARSELFALLAASLCPERVLYPGSFIHLSASFHFPSVVYVDNDRKAKWFFSHAEEVNELVARHKKYDREPAVEFLGKSYNGPLGLPENSFDLLISQYAGFISEACRPYLKLGGLLLANNSHGDAALASLDPHFELVAVVLGPAKAPRISFKALEQYFQPKKPVRLSREEVKKMGRGIGYTHPAQAYLFRRLS